MTAHKKNLISPIAKKNRCMKVSAVYSNPDQTCAIDGKNGMITGFDMGLRCDF